MIVQLVQFETFFCEKEGEAMLACRETDLAKTIPAAYKMTGTPDADVHEMLFPPARRRCVPAPA